jgi:hypothetical protein
LLSAPRRVVPGCLKSDRLLDPSLEILLADADVLIDYRDSDLTILKLVSDHIGPVRVLREVLDEAPGISDRQCARLGSKSFGSKPS